MVKILNLINKKQEKQYFKYFIISIIGLVVLIYFMAIVARVENNNDMQIYSNIFKFICGVEILLFTALSSIFNFKASKEYISKKDLSLKVFSIGISTIIYMVSSYIIVTGIFLITESIKPILINDSISYGAIALGLGQVIISSVIVTSLCIIGIWLTLEKKSVFSSMAISMTIVIVLETIISRLSLSIQLKTSIIVAIVAVVFSFIISRKSIA